MKNIKNKLTRREFVKSTTVGIAGISLGGIPGINLALAETPSKFKTVNGIRYRPYGNTGIMVSEIGFGSSTLTDSTAVEYAIERGMNYIDSCRDYARGRSIEAIGKVLRDPKKREKVILAVKWHPYSKTSKQQMLNEIDNYLKTMNIEYIDVIQIHQVGRNSGGESIERLTNSNVPEAFNEVKKQGKVKFMGITGHDGDLMEVMNHTIEMGIYHTILCRYNHMDYPEQDKLFSLAQKKGIATIAMKTLAGAHSANNIREFRKGNTSYAQAALKWVLSHSNVSCAVISIRSKEQVDEYLSASGQPLLSEDRELLRKYAAQFKYQYCNMCNQCEPACPHDIPIANVLRYDMYYQNYRDVESAKHLYANIPASQRANHCLDCSAPCLNACPSQIAIQTKLAHAHSLLTV